MSDLNFNVKFSYESSDDDQKSSWYQNRNNSVHRLSDIIYHHHHHRNLKTKKKTITVTRVMMQVKFDIFLFILYINIVVRYAKFS